MLDIFHEATEFLLHFLTHSVVSLPLIAAAAWVADRILRRIGPGAQHKMWASALLFAIVLPLLPFSAHLPWHSAVDTASVTTSSLVMQAISTPDRFALPSSLYVALPALYILSVLVSLARLLWRWRRTQQLADASPVLSESEEARTLLQEAAEKRGVHVPELRACAALESPVVLGVRQSVLLLPVDFVESTAAMDVAAAFAHECAHISRRDFAKNLLYELAASMVAYHPVCWWMRRRIAQTRELVCDEMAAGALPSNKSYAASLLRLATSMANRAAAAPLHAIGIFDTNNFNMRSLEERIMQLTKDRPKLSKAKMMLLTAAALCSLPCGALTAAAIGFDVNPQPKETIYHVGPGVTAPVLVFAVDATYPEAERRKKESGVVLLGLVVDSQGMPQDVQVKKSLSSDFDQKAIDAVRQYRFKPSLRRGEPVPVSINIEVHFHLYR